MTARKASRVLIMDDDRALAEVIAAAARAIGLDTEVLCDPLQFDAVYANGQFQAVLLDLGMPHRDGVEILRHLAAADPGARVILVSGYDSATLYTARQLATALGLEVLGNLTKPFRVAEVQRVLAGIDRDADGTRARAAMAQAPISGADMEAAISNNEFAYHFQPQVSLHERSIVGYEALARWQRPDGSSVGPSAFIPVAEKEGLIEPLTWALLRRELPNIGGLERCAPGCVVALNISASMLTDLTLPDRLQALCREYGFEPQRMTLEVTESAVMQDLRRSLDVLVRFRLKGFRLSIDDFGTGSAMLEQLRRLPITEIKIDRSFIAECTTQAKPRAIVENIIDLARRLGGLHTVAEGVENEATATTLTQLGAGFAQGYLFGRPTALEQLTTGTPA